MVVTQTLHGTVTPAMALPSYVILSEKRFTFTSLFNLEKKMCRLTCFNLIKEKVTLLPNPKMV